MIYENSGSASGNDPFNPSSYREVNDLSLSPKTMHRQQQLNQSNDLSLSPRSMQRQTDSFEAGRAAIMSPTNTNRQYNRLKYYSALRTGYKHLATDPQS